MRCFYKSFKDFHGFASIRLSVMLLTLMMLSALLGLSVIQIVVAKSGTSEVLSGGNVITLHDDSKVLTNESWPARFNAVGEESSESSESEGKLFYLPSDLRGSITYRN